MWNAIKPKTYTHTESKRSFVSCRTASFNQIFFFWNINSIWNVLSTFVSIINVLDKQHHNLANGFKRRKMILYLGTVWQDTDDTKVNIYKILSVRTDQGIFFHKLNFWRILANLIKEKKTWAHKVEGFTQAHLKAIPSILFVIWALIFPGNPMKISTKRLLIFYGRRIQVEFLLICKSHWQMKKPESEKIRYLLLASV